MSVLDAGLKITQMCFYVGGLIMAMLTYRAAKRALLNTTHTEYHKKVIERLLELASDLALEFDENADVYWAKSKPMQEIIEGTLKWDETIDIRAAAPNVPRVTTALELRLGRQLAAIVADPLIPRQIRGQVADVFQQRRVAVDDAIKVAFHEYLEAFKAASNPEKLEWHDFSNQYLDALHARGWGVLDTEKKLDGLRLAIQEYFESFDPVRPRTRAREGDLRLSRMSFQKTSPPKHASVNRPKSASVHEKIVVMVNEIIQRQRGPLPKRRKLANGPIADVLQPGELEHGLRPGDICYATFPRQRNKDATEGRRN